MRDILAVLGLTALMCGNALAGEIGILVGSVFPPDIVLTATWLDGTNGVILSGAAASDRSGTSVSGAGDVNGDGYSDFLVGASAADPGGRSVAGSAFLIFGHSNGYSSEIILTNAFLNGTNGVILSGAAENISCGTSVSGAGDVNGDGFADLMVSATGARGSAGETYLVFGRASGFPSEITMTNAWLDGTNGIILAGAALYDQSGISVSGAGDVNGDGYSDLLIGAHGADPGGKSAAGSAYLVFGRASGFPSDITMTNTWLDGTNGFVLSGAAGGDGCGVSVSGAGDVNGDGYSDFLVGASAADPGGRSAAGETYLVFGRTNGFPPEILLTDTWLDGTNGVILSGAAADDQSGYSVSGAGDVNGDGIAELLVGAYMADPGGKSAAGSTHLVYGRTNGFPAEIVLTNAWLDGTNGIILAGAALSDQSGYSVSGAGDVNGDGKADLLVGANLANPGGRADAGETCLVFGQGVTRSFGIAPSSGSVTGGYPVTINGTNLCDGTIGDVTNVTLCGVAAVVTGVSGSTQVVVSAGAAAAGRLGNVVVYSAGLGMSIKTNGFTYNGPGIAVLGTNGAQLASGESAGIQKGTDFGSFTIGGAPKTNVFSVTNGGNAVLAVSGVTTNGPGARSFRLQSSLPDIAPGGVASISTVFSPVVAGVQTAALVFANNSGVPAYVLNLKATVSKLTQAITFPAISAQNPTNKVTLSATASSGLPVSFSVASGPGSIASGVLSFSNTGIVRVVARQAGNAAYAAAIPVTNTVTVNKSAQAITFPAIPAQNPTNRVTLSAAASSGLPVSFSVASGPGSTTAGVLSFSNTGLVRVVASQAGNAAYAAAIPVTNTVSVNKSAQTITFPAIPAQDEDDIVALSATASSGLPVSFSVASGPGIITAGALGFSNTGLVRVVASQAGNAAYAAAIPVTNTVAVTGRGAVMNDYDGDGASDLAVYDSITGYWYAYSLRSGNAVIWARPWGWPGAETVPGDYDGDRTADLTVYDQANGYWYIWSVAKEIFILWARPWGWPGAETVSGDYDGDMISDLAVYDQPSGFWYIITMGDKVLAWDRPWGWTGAITVPGDYDGDRLNDLCVYDSNTGYWYVNTLAGDVLAWETAWGWPGATTVPGDYDGDGKDDMAVYDQPTGAWYVWSHVKQRALVWAEPWGWTGAVPVPGDYDGDKNADLAVFDTITGYWYIWSEIKGVALAWAQNWGWPGAYPPGGRY